MASAVASGVVALLVDEHPRLSPGDVKVTLQMTSTLMPGAGLLASGAGSMNAYAAAEFADGAIGDAVAASLGGDAGAALARIGPAEQHGSCAARVEHVDDGRQCARHGHHVRHHVRARRHDALGQDGDWRQDIRVGAPCDQSSREQDASPCLRPGRLRLIVWGNDGTRTLSSGATTTRTPSSGVTTTRTPSFGATTTRTPSSGVTTTKTPSSGATTTRTPSSGATSDEDSIVWGNDADEDSIVWGNFAQ